MKFKALGLLALLVITASMAGCADRGDARQAADVRITLHLVPAHTIVGQHRVVLTITTAAGQPLDGATVEVRGEMTMAGMAPSVARARGGGDGRYVVDIFRFSMAGDWVLSIRGTLKDGRHLAQQFPSIQVAPA